MSKRESEQKKLFKFVSCLHTSDKIAFRMNGDLDIRVVDCQNRTEAESLFMYERHLFSIKLRVAKTCRLSCSREKLIMWQNFPRPTTGALAEDVYVIRFALGFLLSTPFHFASRAKWTQQRRFDVILLSQHATDSEFLFPSSSFRAKHIHTDAKTNLIY